MRVHLSDDASMALAAGTTACASIDAVVVEKFRAVIREAAAKAAQKASLKQPRDIADTPSPRAASAAGAQASGNRCRGLKKTRGKRLNSTPSKIRGKRFCLL